MTTGLLSYVSMESMVMIYHIKRGNIMKKRILIFLIVVALLVFAVGCAKNESTTPSTQSENESVTKEKEEQPKEVANNEEPDEPEKEEGLFDKSLTGLDLLKSITYKEPKTMLMESETSLAAGGDMKTVTYMKGESTRMEMEVMGQRSIVIYNADEGVTYQYVEGDEVGFMFPDGEDAEGGMLGDMGMGMDMEVPDISEITEIFGEGAIARVENLDGHEVIYVETKMTEEGMEMTMKMWFSIEYHVPLKFEMTMGDTQLMSQKVTNIEVNEKMDDSLFLPPSNVEFEEFSVDSVFGD